MRRFRQPFSANLWASRMVALHPSYLGTLASIVRGDLKVEPQKAYYDDDDFGDLQCKIVMDGSIARLRLKGVLTQDPEWDWYSGCTLAWGEIVEVANRLYDDMRVEGVWIDLDSPGGETAGMLDACEQLRTMRNKPTWIFTESCACSAASILSGAWGHKLIASMMADLSMVGVVRGRLDVSAAMAGQGVNLIWIGEGARKTEEYPETPATDENLAGIRQRIANAYAEIVPAYARYRGVSEDVVRGTQSAILSGQQALDAKAIDQLSGRTAAYGDFKKFIAGSPVQGVS